MMCASDDEDAIAVLLGNSSWFGLMATGNRVPAYNNILIVCVHVHIRSK